MTLAAGAAKFARGLLAAGFAATLSGCASFDFPDLNRATRAVASTLGRGDAANVAAFEFDVQAPERLRKLLLNHLDLARFQTAPAAEGITTSELDRLIRAAPAQARALLETEGYFNATVEVDRVPNAGSLPKLTMTVATGPGTTVAAVELNATGALDAASRSGDPAAIEALGQWRRQWPLRRCQEQLAGATPGGGLCGCLVERRDPGPHRCTREPRRPVAGTRQRATVPARRTADRRSGTLRRRRGAQAGRF